MVYCSNDTRLAIKLNKLGSEQVHLLREEPVKISIGETVLDHPVCFPQNIIFDEASVIKSRTFWHAPDTIFMGFHLVFGPQTVIKLIITIRNARFEALTAIDFVSR
jgi:hypothetical protein